VKLADGCNAGARNEELKGLAAELRQRLSLTS
jgi:hypothetical protein